jgi:hypothetical protein
MGLLYLYLTMCQKNGILKMQVADLLGKTSYILHFFRKFEGLFKNVWIDNIILLSRPCRESCRGFHNLDTCYASKVLIYVVRMNST